jgi:predicted transposase YdaD
MTDPPQTNQYDKIFRENKVNQLRGLAQLRRLKQLTNLILDSVLTFFREEDDPLFIRGEQRGEQNTLRKLVLNLLTKSEMSVEQIAQIAEVPVDFVRQLQQENQA